MPIRQIHLRPNWKLILQVWLARFSRSSRRDLWSLSYVKYFEVLYLLRAASQAFQLCSSSERYTLLLCGFVYRCLLVVLSASETGLLLLANLPVAFLHAQAWFRGKSLLFMPLHGNRQSQEFAFRSSVPTSLLRVQHGCCRTGSHPNCIPSAIIPEHFREPQHRRVSAYMCRYVCMYVVEVSLLYGCECEWALARI